MIRTYSFIHFLYLKSILIQYKSYIDFYKNPFFGSLIYISNIINRLCGVMISVPAWSPVDRGFDTRSGKIKDHKLVYAASPAYTGWLKSWIMCLIGATCLPVDYCSGWLEFNLRVELVENRHHHHHILDITYS